MTRKPKPKSKPRVDWKSRALASETELAAVRFDLAAKNNQIEYLIRTIRQTDDIIFSISQCTHWEAMRPRVAQLTDQMTARKVAESNRITSLIVNELHNTYRPNNEMGKQQAALPSPEDGKR